jgi:hypothetical protein
LTEGGALGGSHIEAADGAHRATRWVSGEFTLVLPPKANNIIGSSIRGSRVPVNHTAPQPVADSLMGASELVH